jgi:uncharacterized protein (DUF2235 family)
MFRMIERTQGVQVAYYDPGVGTMGDPMYKTLIARKINKGLGLAFGRGLTKNLIAAYTYLMEHYKSGDRIFCLGSAVAPTRLVHLRRSGPTLRAIAE